MAFKSVMDASVGLTEVYNPGDESHVVDIVLVHGLFGHPQKTWTRNTPASSHESNTNEPHVDSDCPPRKKIRTGRKELFREVFWPRDLLPKVLPNARILTWGYDVQIEQMLSPTSKVSIFQHSETLLSDLTTLRSSTSDKKKPLIFIAHSLGGIVVKDALSLSKIETTSFNEILPATRGVIFLGTPHRGSKAASLGKIAFEISRVFLKDPNLKILSALENGSEILERISKSFGLVLASQHIKVHSFQEELKTHGIDIVDASSSTIGYHNESRSTLHANHRNMAKYSSTDDANFQRVSSLVRRWVDEIGRYHSLESDFSRARSEFPDLSDNLIFDEEYKKCLKTLNAVQARTRLENVRPAYEKTYDWLFGSPTGFRSWIAGENSNSIYWICGKPGSGKSTLMKFAMTHSLTRELLQNCSSGSWVITGYFFHDRGTEIQKSVKGFLREILYQILRKRRELFSTIYTAFHASNSSTDTSTSTGAQISRNFASSWSLDQLREALLEIGSKAPSALNICLFVDALDEHDGNHRDLISILMELAQLPQSPMFRLRLCLAGRPENVFKDAFRTCPGFAIQDHTTADIRHYAEDRIRKEHRGVLDDRGKLEAYSLVESIVERANGVFLWVRLVVDEMVEGLCEGDTLEELTKLLSEIPTELGDLYTRAIRRVRRTSAPASAELKYEAYVMFQITISAQVPLELDEFLGAAIFLTTGERCSPNSSRLSRDQKERRLNSRSASLLEIDDDLDVQFIHQTVKEFMISENGERLMRENIGNKRAESGNVFLLQYIISELPRDWAIENFLHYAKAVETKEREPAGKYFEPTVGSLTELMSITSKIIKFSDHFSNSACWLNEVADKHNSHIVQLLSFYVVGGLHLSLDRCIKAHKADIDDKLSVDLIEAALTRGSSLTSFDILLKAGIGADIPQKSIEWIDRKLDSYIYRINNYGLNKEPLRRWSRIREQLMGDS